MSVFEEKILRHFRTIDRDNDDTITFDELLDIFHKCGVNREESQIRQLFQFIDGNRDNKVTLDELRKVMAMNSDADKRDCDYRADFKELHKDNSGILTAKELEGYLKKHKFDGDVKAIIAKADMNGDGVISYEEFLALIK